MDVIVAVNENCLFRFVIADPPQDSGGKLQGLALHCVRAEVNEFRLYAILYQLGFEERAHAKDVMAMGRIARYAAGGALGLERV